MKVLLKADGRTQVGGAPLLMHNERLSDPLDPFARSLAEVTKKRTKTLADHEEISYREFLGGLYTNGNGPCEPAQNIIRCLQDGAKRHKRGMDVPRGIFPIIDHADVQYDGPRDPEELWRSGDFSLRKGVGIKGNRTMRTRPCFIDWTFALEIEMDPVIFDADTIDFLWTEAGKYAGIGDGRPTYGRFVGSTEVVA